MKRLFYTSLALFLLVVIFLLAYNFAFKTNINDAKAPDNKTTSKEPPLEDGAKDTPLNIASAVTNPINENILGAVTGPGTTISYYSLDDQAFKRASLEGKDKTTLLSNLPGKPLRIIWSSKRDSALVLVENTPKPRWYSAQFTTKTLTPLKTDITRVAWNNLGDKIYYLFQDPNTSNFSLNKAAIDGSDWKEILSLDKKDVYLAPVPQTNAVSFWTKPNALEESFFDSVDADTNKRAKLFSSRFGADYLWSPNGERVLVSSSTQKSGPLSLGIINKNGGEFQSLNIPTLITKVVWSKDNNKLFYALPGGLDGATLPNDYFSKNLASEDTFWQIDLSTGKSTRLLELGDIGQSFDSSDLQLSPNEDILFFTDRQTKRLYRIDL